MCVLCVCCAQEYAHAVHARVWEASARTGKNVEAIMQSVCDVLWVMYGCVVLCALLVVYSPIHCSAFADSAGLLGQSTRSTPARPRHASAGLRPRNASNGGSEQGADTSARAISSSSSGEQNSGFECGGGTEI